MADSPTFDSLTFNRDVGMKLKAMLKSPDFPHIIINGSPGCGKKTIMRMILAETYGNFATHKEEINDNYVIVMSTHHMEFSSLVQVYDVAGTRASDNAIISDIIAEFPIKSGLGDKYNTIVFHDSTFIDTSAINALKRVMEVHIARYRFIFITNNIDQISDPIRSRCTQINLPTPTHAEMAETLTGFGLDVPFKDIINRSCRNLKYAIHHYQALCEGKEITDTFKTCSDMIRMSITESDLNSIVDATRFGISEFIDIDEFVTFTLHCIRLFIKKTINDFPPTHQCVKLVRTFYAKLGESLYGFSTSSNKFLYYDTIILQVVELIKQYMSAKR
jgi:DNA polymerase III delta prime subunit